MNSTQTHLNAEITVAPLLAVRDAPAAFFHQDSEAVRFWVPVADWLVGASIRKGVLQHRFLPQGIEEEPIETYERHAAELRAAVQRRVAQGSMEPVMLRDFDLRPNATNVEPDFA